MMSKFKVHLNMGSPKEVEVESSTYYEEDDWVNFYDDEENKVDSFIEGVVWRIEKISNR
jgi:hypothetical protein